MGILLCGSRYFLECLGVPECCLTSGLSFSALRPLRALLIRTEVAPRDPGRIENGGYCEGSVFVAAYPSAHGEKLTRCLFLPVEVMWYDRVAAFDEGRRQRLSDLCGRTGGMRIEACCYGAYALPGLVFISTITFDRVTAVLLHAVLCIVGAQNIRRQ